jgi:membrane protein implicated in regulation of membrane protease activity
MASHDWSDKVFRFLITIALLPFVLLCMLEFILAILRQLPIWDLALLFLLLAIASPVAYWLRQSRGRARPREGAKRGAERTPLLPRHEEEE